jgi:flagellar assembly protein FliH
MTVFRSRSQSAAPQALPGAGRADNELARRLTAAREEGRQQALRESAAQLGEAQRLRSEVETTVATVRREAEERLAPVLRALSASLDDLENLEAQLIQAAETDLVRLAVAIAQRVLAHQVETDPAWMRDVLTDALKRLPDRRQVAIRLHPHDAALAREQLARLADAAGGSPLTIVDDPGLPRGGCILHSEGTTLDAGVAGAVSRLGERLLQAAPRPDCWVAVDTGANEVAS